MKRIISVILLSGLLGACQAPDGGSDNFYRSLNNTSHGYQIVTAPEPVRFGKVSERFEVRNGDCSSQDCATDRERSELSGPRYSGGPHWYGWSIYVPKDYVNIFPTRTTLGQFHQQGKGSKPVFMFQNHGGGLWAERHVMGGVGVSKNLRG